MRDAEEISSIFLGKRVLDICASSLLSVAKNYCKCRQKSYLNTTEVSATQGRNTQSVTHQCSIKHHLDKSLGESPQSTRMVCLHI